MAAPGKLLILPSADGDVTERRQECSACSAPPRWEARTPAAICSSKSNCAGQNPLAGSLRTDENGAVRRGLPIALLALVTLALAAAQSGSYHDRDSYGAPRTSAAAPPPEARIDINHASMSQLLKVPGMTPSWAGRIVRFRPYRAKTDLLDRGVVTLVVYERIKDYVIAHRNP